VVVGDKGDAARAGGGAQDGQVMAAGVGGDDLDVAGAFGGGARDGHVGLAPIRQINAPRAGGQGRDGGVGIGFGLDGGGGGADRGTGAAGREGIVQGVNCVGVG